MVWASIAGRSWSSQKNSKRKKKRYLKVALDHGVEFEESVKQYMEGKEHTWEELSNALEEALEEHCPVDRNRFKLWMIY